MTPTPSTPQPSAEAMAAANKVYDRTGMHNSNPGVTDDIIYGYARIIDAEFAALRAENESSKKAVEVIQHAHAEISGAYLDRTVELTSLRQRLERAEEALKEIANLQIELFEDGLAADLHADGIRRVTDAYMQGFKDSLQETKEIALAAMSETSAKPGEGEKL